MFPSSSRLDVLMLQRRKTTIPIDINYNCEYEAVKTKGMGSVLAALKRPDPLQLQTTADLNRLFDTSNCPSPLGLCDQYNKELKLLAAFLFLKGSDLHLRPLFGNRHRLAHEYRVIVKLGCQCDWYRYSLLDQLSSLQCRSLVLSYYSGEPRVSSYSKCWT